MIDATTYTTEQIRNFQQLMLEARRSRGMTQVEAASKIGVSQTMISNLERGPQPGMRVGELFRVLAYYHIEPNLVAEVLGYWNDSTAERDDPRFIAVVEGLASLPDTLYDQIIRALELMLHGASDFR
jgi:transcriptional regulator with XRE-family HTH domain